MTKSKVIFRVDGSSEIGLGHISRCCALADMLRHNFEIYFYTRATSKAVINDIQQYCSDVFQLDKSIAYNEEAFQWISVLEGNEIVVLDGYNFNTNYQQQIKNKGCKLVCIDDIYAYHFIADAVINHAPGIDKKKYSVELYTQLYLGTDYVLLKKMFLEEAAKSNKNFNLQQSPILICLGGSDPKNITIQVLEHTLRLLPGKKINIVVGAAYKHLSTLQEACNNNKQVTLHVNIQPEEMLSIMQQSHIAVTSASTTALEYICVKGNLFLKLIADNQKNIYQSLIEKNCAHSYEDIQKNFYSNTISQQYKLIDGKSNQRLIKIFESLSLIEKKLEFKLAENKNADLLFSWINDPAVRTQSLSASIVSYPEHINWFKKKMADKNSLIYIVYENNVPAGMIRFDINDNACTISYLVDKLHRGKGIGALIVNFGIKQFKAASDFKGCFKATVKNTNIPSLKIFERAEFKKTKTQNDLIYFERESRNE